MASETNTPATHRYVGDHAAEILGVMREPGEMLALSKENLEDDHVADLINVGQISTLSDFDKGGDKVNG